MEYANLIQIIKQYLAWEKIKEEKKYNDLLKPDRDNLRLEYDEDAKYYLSQGYTQQESLYADTIISFWMPYKIAIYNETHWMYSKTVKSLELLLKNINEDKDGKYNKVNKEFNKFATVCYTPGNYMLLRNREMNIHRTMFEDRFDETLYNCFDGGEFNKYFDGEKDLIQWINEQNLSVFFKDGLIEKRNIKHLFENVEFPYFIIRNKNIFKYVDQVTQLIEKRNVLINSIEEPK